MAKIFSSTYIYLTMSKLVRNFLIYLFILSSGSGNVLSVLALCQPLSNRSPPPPPSKFYRQYTYIRVSLKENKLYKDIYC